MLFFILLSRLPFFMLYGLSEILNFIVYRVLRYRKDLVTRNLRNSFPEKSDRELHRIRKHFYNRLFDSFVETLKLLTISKQELEKRMCYQGLEQIEACKKENKSILVLTSHQFNWEWLLVRMSFALPLSLGFVYQTQTNRLINRLLVRIRTRFGAHSIERKNVAREVFNKRNTWHVIALVADQFPGHANDKKNWVRFLHQDTAFFQGIDHMAFVMQYTVFFCRMHRIKRGYYKTEIIRIAEPPYGKEDLDIIRRYSEEMEKTILQDPPGWLWSHNRWKKQKPIPPPHSDR